MELLFLILIIVLIKRKKDYNKYRDQYFDELRNRNNDLSSENSKNTQPNQNTKQEDIIQGPNIDYSKYYKKDYVMTSTELNFYRKLKTITDNLELTIFPQVDLERIVRVYNDDFAYRNRIKSRSIDFTIVNNKNCRIVCCIELDDYYHNRKDRIERDIFINNLFQNVAIELIHVKVGNYDLAEIENNIKGAL